MTNICAMATSTSDSAGISSRSRPNTEATLGLTPIMMPSTSASPTNGAEVMARRAKRLLPLTPSPASRAAACAVSENEAATMASSVISLPRNSSTMRPPENTSTRSAVSSSASSVDSQTSALPAPAMSSHRR